MINESTITRVMSHLSKYDCATITAYRNTIDNVTDGTLESVLEYEGAPVPTDVKKAWNRELKAALTKLGYGVTKIKGLWREDGWDASSSEESFLVVNLSDDQQFVENLMRLGEAYNQDAILIKEKDNENAYLVGTNLADWPGYHKTIDVGALHVNVPLAFVGASSQIGNKAFKFESDEAHRNGIYLETYLNGSSFSMKNKSDMANRVLEEAGIDCQLRYSEYNNIATESERLYYATI